MNILQCYLTENRCYKTKQTIVPKGVMIHSTGANNPNLKRYVQPMKTASNYSPLIAKLSKSALPSSESKNILYSSEYAKSL